MPVCNWDHACVPPNLAQWLRLGEGVGLINFYLGWTQTMILLIAVA
jgi:hypothetical protein